MPALHSSCDPEQPLPKRNYGFEKRQREIAKRKKREERLKRRRASNARSEAVPDDQADDPGSTDTPAIQP